MVFRVELGRHVRHVVHVDMATTTRSLLAFRISAPFRRRVYGLHRHGRQH